MLGACNATPPTDPPTIHELTVVPDNVQKISFLMTEYNYCMKRMLHITLFIIQKGMYWQVLQLREIGLLSS